MGIHAETKPQIISLLIRLVLASPFIVVCVTGWGLFLSPFMGIVAAIIIAPPLAGMMADAVVGWMTPNQAFDKPQPIMGIPLSLRSQGAYEEAVNSLEAMILEHPGHLPAHDLLLHICTHDLRDSERARGYFESSLPMLANDADRERLQRTHTAYQSLLLPSEAGDKAPVPMADRVAGEPHRRVIAYRKM